MGDAPPPDLASDDDDDDDNDGGGGDGDGMVALPPGTRFVAEYENGDLEEIGGMDDAEGPPPPPDMATQTFEGHTGPIYAVAIHPQNPQLMLTGGGDDRAFFWQATTTSATASSADNAAGHVTELANHGDSVNAVGFSSDGTLAATGAYSGKILVWDAATRALLRTLEGPEDVEWMDWHPKGNLLLAGSKDTTIWMWLAATGDCIKVFTGHEDGVTCGGFTSDGKLIVSGSSDGSVRVWGPKLGICKHVFSGYGFHEGPITALVSHPMDGAMLLSGGMDGTARLLHVTNKKVLATMVHSEPKAVEEGTTPMEEDEDQMQEEDEEGGGKQQQEGNFSVETVGFSAVLNWCATGGMDGTLKIWDLGTFVCVFGGGGGGGGGIFNHLLSVIYLTDQLSHPPSYNQKHRQLLLPARLRARRRPGRDQVAVARHPALGVHGGHRRCHSLVGRPQRSPAPGPDGARGHGAGLCVALWRRGRGRGLDGLGRWQGQGLCRRRRAASMRRMRDCKRKQNKTFKCEIPFAWCGVCPLLLFVEKRGWPIS